MTKKICLSLCGGLMLLLASCSNNEFDPVAGQDAGSKAVGFNAVTGKQAATRVASTTSASIADFEAWAYQGTAFVANLGDATAPNGVKVDKTSGAWAYSPIAVWPDGEVTFNAVSPYASQNVVTRPAAGDATGIKTVVYEVPQELDKQGDFLAASAIRSWGIAQNVVTLNFKHALSRIVFQARLADGDPVDLTSISLLNLKMKGSLDITAASPAATPAQWAAAWTPDAASELDVWDVGPAAGSPIHLTKADGYKNVVNVTTTPEPDSSIMILPQVTTLGVNKSGATAGDVTAAESGADFNIAVSWMAAGVPKTSLCAVGSLTDPLNLGIAFEPGKQYVIRLSLDSETNLVKVGDVTVSVLDAGTVATAPVNPQNGAGAIVKTSATDSLLWSYFNVDAPGHFTEKEYQRGRGYELKINIGWDHTQATPISGIDADGNAVTAWTAATGFTAPWQPSPCPAGWRLPTRDEYVAMANAAVKKDATIVASLGGTPGYLFQFANGHRLFFPSSTPQVHYGASGGIKTIGSNGALYWSQDGYRLYITTANGWENPAINSGNSGSDPYTSAYFLRCVRDFK